MSVPLRRAGRLLVGLTLPSFLLGSCTAASESSDGSDATDAPRAQQVQAGPATRIDLRILVLTSYEQDGNGKNALKDSQPYLAPASQMVVDLLSQDMVPFEELNLSKEGRTRISDSFLSDTQGGVRRAKYQAVILHNDAQGLSDVEREALRKFEAEFQIRQLDTYGWPSPAKGLRSFDTSLVEGATLDGITATLTADARAGDFAYLAGSFLFDDASPAVSEQYGYFAQPALERPTSAARGAPSFTPLVTATVPEGLRAAGQSAALLGIHQHDGLEEMVLTASMNAGQLAPQVLFPGMLRWLTKGVHLGTRHNYLSVHVDDVFPPNVRWQKGDLILMNPADVQEVVSWQQEQKAAGSDVKLDIVFNGQGYEEPLQKKEGERTSHDKDKIALGEELIKARHDLRWINHTFNHVFLGCLRDADNKCRRKTDDGSLEFQTADVVIEQISLGFAFARKHKISLDSSELVTGEHGGLRDLDAGIPDNPNLMANLSLSDAGAEEENSERTVRDAATLLPIVPYKLAFLGSDSSRDMEQRSIGAPHAALTVPRHPMNIYFDCGKIEDEVDRYRMTYPERATGDVASTFATIVREEVATTLKHMTQNDPRPHYVHQPNLTEDRLLYRVLTPTLEAYRKLFTKEAPIVNPTMAQAGVELRQRAVWKTSSARVQAYREGDKLVLTAPAGTEVPITVPVQSKDADPSVWAGSRTGWQTIDRDGETRITLPSSE